MPLRESTVRIAPPIQERRKRLRAEVHWPVRFPKADGEPFFESHTENLSSKGFYCFFEQRLAPGEWLECLILIPTQCPRCGEEMLGLYCSIQVARVEALDGGTRFGVGFRIENYEVLHRLGDRPCPAPKV